MNTISILALIKAVGTLLEQVLVVSDQFGVDEKEAPEAINETRNIEFKLKNLEQRISKNTK